LDDPDSELSDSDNLDDFDQLNEDYDSVDGSDEEMDEEDQSELEDQPVIEKSKPSLQKAKEIETKQEVLLKSNPTPDSSSTSTQKYVPPRLRQLNEGDQIRKRLRGLLNRVSEANVSILVAEIQTIFETTPRNRKINAYQNFKIKKTNKELTLIGYYY
jgi:nucleolar MIF4G domain-containing protein 1